MIFVLLLTTFLAVLIIRQYQKARKLPPGPVSLPLIGNIHQLVYHIWNEKGVVPAFDLFRKVSIIVINFGEKLINLQKYGDVFTIWLGPIPHVSICNYETSQEVFVKNGNKYKDRFLPPVYLHVSSKYQTSIYFLQNNFSDNLGLFTANGPVCAEMRKFTLLAFRNMGVGRDLMEQRILDELNTRYLWGFELFLVQKKFCRTFRRIFKYREKFLNSQFPVQNFEKSVSSFRRFS